MYDIIIIGAGPAGLTAALYARRAGKSVLIIEKSTFGGQITFSPKVENIPGFLSVSGNEFAEKMVEQVLEHGADIEMCEVFSIESGDVKIVQTDSGSFEGKTVIIATGAKHRTLKVENEEKFIGNGISFCAVCDGAFYKDKTVAVIGGGNSALQEALLLSEVCKKVIMVQNLDFLTGEKMLCEKVESKDNIEVILSTTVSKVNAGDIFTGIEITSSSGENTILTLDGMFIAIGLIPQNECFKNIISLDKFGYADYDDTLSAGNGIFVAGDCRKKKIRQVATAASDGAIAALAACDYVDSIG